MRDQNTPFTVLCNLSTTHHAQCLTKTILRLPLVFATQSWSGARFWYSDGLCWMLGTICMLSKTKRKPKAYETKSSLQLHGHHRNRWIHHRISGQLRISVSWSLVIFACQIREFLPWMSHAPDTSPRPDAQGTVLKFADKKSSCKATTKGIVQWPILWQNWEYPLVI